MKKNKIDKRVNGGLSLYYGFGMLAVGFIAIIASVVTAVKIILYNGEFTWGAVIGILVIGIVIGALGYALTRSGYEEMEE